MKEKFSGIVMLPDGRIVRLRPSRMPEMVQNSKWVEYEGNLGDVTLGTELTEEEIKRLCPIDE